MTPSCFLARTDCSRARAVALPWTVLSHLNRGACLHREVVATWSVAATKSQQTKPKGSDKASLADSDGPSSTQRHTAWKDGNQIALCLSKAKSPCTSCQRASSWSMGEVSHASLVSVQLHIPWMELRPSPRTQEPFEFRS